MLYTPIMTRITTSLRCSCFSAHPAQNLFLPYKPRSHHTSSHVTIFGTEYVWSSPTVKIINSPLCASTSTSSE